MKRVFTAAFLLTLWLAVPAFATADAADPGKSLSVRTFQFKHKQADKAAVVIAGLLSAEGSVAIQPSANSLIVTDAPENMRKVAAALAAFDAPVRPYRLSIRLVSAARAAAEQSKVSEGLSDVAPKLALLRYNVIDRLAAADVAGSEGEAGLVDLNGYRADFQFGEYDASSDSMQLSDFRLSRLEGEQLTPVLKTNVNLKLGQTVIIGATKQPQSQRALMIVMTATR